MRSAAAGPEKSAAVKVTGKPAGVILAGGRSSRMGGPRKALLELDGRPLLEHVMHRLQAHTEPLLISSEGENRDFDDFGLKQVPDLLPGYRGPLMGLYSALQYLSDESHDKGLILCPCDAPFIPDNLVEVLCKAGSGENKPVVAVSYQGVLQPTFSLWQIHHLPLIRETVVNKGKGGLKYLLQELPHEIVEWGITEPPAFYNVNTPEEFKTAEVWLDRMRA